VIPTAVDAPRSGYGRYLMEPARGGDDEVGLVQIADTVGLPEKVVARA
jgi:hypothetical protein